VVQTAQARRCNVRGFAYPRDLLKPPWHRRVHGVARLCSRSSRGWRLVKLSTLFLRLLILPQLIDHNQTTLIISVFSNGNTKSPVFVEHPDIAFLNLIFPTITPNLNRPRPYRAATNELVDLLYLCVFNFFHDLLKGPVHPSHFSLRPRTPGLQI
jgi:hypothetical protein